MTAERHHTTGAFNALEEKLSWPKNPRVTPETSEWGRGRRGRTERKGREHQPCSVPSWLQRDDRAIIVRSCPPTEPELIWAGFRSSPGRQRQGAVFEGQRPALEALPASPLLEGRETEHFVLLTEASRLPGAHIRPMTLTESGRDRQAGRSTLGNQSSSPKRAILRNRLHGVSLCL